jgi:hypothetical protein
MMTVTKEIYAADRNAADRDMERLIQLLERSVIQFSRSVNLLAEFHNAHPSRPTAMDRNMILNHLANAERHVAEGSAHVERQRELVERLSGHGHIEAAARANQLLAQKGH